MIDVDTLLQWRYHLEVLILATAVVGLVLCVDDFYVDLNYWFLRLTGRLRDEQHGLPDPKVLAGLRQKPLAVMVPAWQESDVIYAMLSSNLRLVQYAEAHYFVGVYENDPATLHEVDRARQLSPHVHAVIVPRPGPTSKADCLNEILTGAVLLEKKLGISFAGYVMHDAEDMIHPLELQVFNAALDRHDFIQLPVYSFTRRTRDWVASAYMDEFAEAHNKDLPVREHLSGFIPCAGVSACFSHRAIEAMANEDTGHVFHTASLTEDYDAAFRLARLGLSAVFIRYEAGFYMDTPRGLGSPQLIKEPEVVATREHFPSKLRAAYRQRARWILGIAIVGIEELGWRGNFGTRFFLVRDRKGLFAIPTVIFGYFLFALFVPIRLTLWWIAPGVYAQTAMTTHEAYVIIGLSLFMVLWRVGHRSYFTGRLYGWRHGLLAGPRMIFSNFLNFFAVCRAVRLYVVHLITGDPLLWDKTAHTYPDQLPSQLPSLLRPSLKSGQSEEDAAREELERVMHRPGAGGQTSP